DAPLGHPIGEKGKQYDNREDIFIREFTNGWVVYNRSKQAQSIELPMQATGVYSGITSMQHTVPDLDGEIYLKSLTPLADVNDDGIVNVLDLVLVANAFGEAEPDMNGDGVVNILDLVIVANAF
ncbi:MAG: dockerin type I domain-containing protein, partial [Candidatus Poribacteria bacterium]|nr:dockerin type I domain-containing protein [Candidatus Poribacteria bacterium]